jgi:GNAT superfamily N-acetyltransferase
MTPLRIRPMKRPDAATVAVLSAQLGYPSSAQVVADRLARLEGQALQAMFVAESTSIAGWMHVIGVRRLDSEGCAEVLSLVVDEQHRRRGVGRALIDSAEAWARTVGFKRLRLRSGHHRVDAHAFYAALGFDVTRPGHTFQRSL